MTDEQAQRVLVPMRELTCSRERRQALTDCNLDCNFSIRDFPTDNSVDPKLRFGIKNGKVGAPDKAPFFVPLYQGPTQLPVPGHVERLDERDAFFSEAGIIVSFDVPHGLKWWGLQSPGMIFH